MHSKFAFLSPKKLKDKSRWMNLDTCVEWANSIIAFKKNMPEKMQLIQIDKKTYKRSFKEIFGWLDHFEPRIQLWNSILEIVSIARDEVKTNGLRVNTLDHFNERVQMVQDQSEYVVSVIDELRIFLKKQTEGIAPDQKFLGTSDALESVFAKYKNFSARTPMKGVGKSVLTIPIFLGNITKEKIINALKDCNIEKMKVWIKDNVGQSVFAQRKLAFDST